MFGVLRTVTGGWLRSAPRHSRVALQKCTLGALRYYEVELTVGKDGPGAALALLYEQIRPFMSPRLLCGGERLEGVQYFRPAELTDELLTQTALKVACYLGGVATVISPSPDAVSTAKRFVPYCSEVRLITPFSVAEAEDVAVLHEISAVQDSTVVLALSGFAGISLPARQHLRSTAVFTNCPQYFCDGLVIDGAEPRLPQTLKPPPSVSRCDLAGACYSLCGMRGLASLTPLRLFSGRRAVGFDDIVERVQGTC
ncbi:MAG: hypothetical protein IJC25_01680 [Clostridia bacterium]|nr:hypothetical protein [Clostridia bacterium]